jgi:L,D-transpeptidase catalytic domain
MTRSLVCLLTLGALALGTTAVAANRGDALVETTLVATTAAPARNLLSRLHGAAPKLDRNVLAMALDARACALRTGAVAQAARLAVIDYSKPSTEPRMWVFDLERVRLLYAEHVAHGRGSGENVANAFSNRDGSYQSSLGLFATADTYIGGNGYSLRMDGLEPGFNDRARNRAIVMHGAPYVDPLQALRQGRLGRSLGCPALRPAIARDVINTIKDGQLLFAYYPDPDWLAQSRFLRCGERTQRAPAPSANAAP